MPDFSALWLIREGKQYSVRLQKLYRGWKETIGTFPKVGLNRPILGTSLNYLLGTSFTSQIPRSVSAALPLTKLWIPTENNILNINLILHCNLLKTLNREIYLCFLNHFSANLFRQHTYGRCQPTLLLFFLVVVPNSMHRIPVFIFHPLLFNVLWFPHPLS